MNVKLTSRYIGPCHNTILVSPKKLFFYTKIKKKEKKGLKIKNTGRQTTWLEKVGKKGYTCINEGWRDQTRSSTILKT
jgi:hypothetical protein